MPWARDKWLFRSLDFWGGAGIVVLFVASGVIIAPLAKRGYERWSTNRYVRLASESLENGDMAKARDYSQSAMGINPWNAEAIRIMAKSLEASNPREALQWRHHLARFMQGDPENTVALAKDAVKNGALDAAEHAMEGMQQADRNSAAYHDVAALIAQAKRDVSGASAHWREALRLDPAGDGYRLSLATLQARNGTPAERVSALETLKELSAKPAQRLGSLRAMLEISMRDGDDAQSRELAKKLVADPKATFEDKLLRLATLRTLNDPEATPLLLELRDASISNPEELYRLFSWMNQNNLALMVSEWVENLPEKVVGSPPQAVAIAEACARTAEWEKLKKLLVRSHWGNIESVRYALLARALLRLNDAAGSDAAWKSSLEAADRNADLLESLAKTSLDWEWNERAEEALWKLSAHPRCPRWVLDSLRARAFQRGDAVQLHRVSIALSRIDPANVAAADDVVFFGLLTRSRERGLHERAEAIYKSRPSDARVVVIRGLSLYARARAAEAVAVMETLKPAQLREPEAARYYGLFLAATGQPAKAKEYLELGAGGTVMREEAGLLALAKMGASDEAAARLRDLNAALLSNGDDFAKLVAGMNAKGLAPLVSAWSATLDRDVVSKPPASVAIAEADVQANKWQRLKDVTEYGSWGESESMREAFQSLALDRLGDSAGAEVAWKHALENASKSAAALDAIARAALRWGWRERTEAALWELSTFDDCPRWALDTLWEAASKRSDSAQLYRVGRLLAEMDPKNIAIRNNAAALSLLLRGGDVATNEIAEALHKEAPGDAEVATTYALSLYLQGRVEDAIGVMRSLTLGQLSAPRPAFYHGVFLTAGRQAEEARPYVEIGAKRALLPEEKELLAMAKIGPTGDSAAYLRQLNDAVSSAESLSNLITHLTGSDFAPLASGWAVGLAPEIASKPPVCVAIAEAHAAAAEWARLKEATAATSWGKLDFERNAFLSRAFDRLGDDNAAAAAWKRALDAAQKDPAALEILAKAVLNWGWEQKAEGVLWRLAGDPFCPRWALDSLWKISTKRRRAADLVEIDRMMPGTDPKRERSRNNAVLLALLTHGNEAAVREFAEALYSRTPPNAAVASVYAVSLLQQNRRDEAAAALKPYTAEGLRELRSAFYYGVYLTVSGQREKAGEFLAIAERARLLAEEDAVVVLAKRAGFPDDLAALRVLNETAASKPESLPDVVTEMVGHGFAELVSAWSATLVGEIGFRQSLRIALAGAHEKAQAWRRLKDITESGLWGRLEYERSALLARALDRTNDLKGAAIAWKAAVKTAKKSREALDALAKNALRWGWQERAEEVLWKMSGSDLCPRWALDSLRDAAFKHGSARQIYEVSKLLAKADPRSAAFRSDVIFFGLLSRSDDGGLHESAEAAWREAPADANIVTAYALSLFERARVKDALGVMQTLKPEQLREPRAALYHGIFLSAAGQSAEAGEFLRLGGKVPLLRDEKALLALANLPTSAESVKSLRQLNAAASSPDSLARLVTQMLGQNLAPLVSAWSLSLVPEVASRPPACVAIADAHAKAGEWIRLKELAEAGAWGDLDYLRHAFLSRAMGRIEDAAHAADAWRSAMSAAEKNSDKLEALAKTALEWGWPGRSEEVLWKLSDQERCPQWAIETLTDFSRKRRESGQPGGPAVVHDPQIERTRRSAIVRAMFARTNEAAIRELSESLYNESPTDPATASIFALSMTQRGRSNAALAMMDAFRPEKLREPQAALYYGIFLSVARQQDRAREFLDIAAKSPLSLDEKALLLRVIGVPSYSLPPVTTGGAAKAMPVGAESAIR